MATNVKRKKKKAEVMAEDGSMTLTGHLKELRNRLIICAVVFVVGVVVSLAYADRLIDLLTAMGRDYYEFVSIAPQEKLMQYFRVSILAGVVVTVPVAFYHIYAFARPGLKRSESTFFKLVMLLGLILFCVGVLFAYKLMMPFMLRFLSTGIEGAEYIQTTTSIESYVNLCLTMFIIFGCVFEIELDLITRHPYYKEKYGFVPADSVPESVSWGLEMAYYDSCISQIAAKAGNKELAKEYAAKAEYYKRYLDPETKMMRGVMGDGSFRTPFNPRYSSHMKSDYTEGNAFQWSFFAPHDMDNFISTIGGKKELETRLDTLFTTSSQVDGEEASGDITGLIGQYAHGNEPSHHMAYLYNWTDSPWKGQERLDQIMQNFYTNAPDGIIGNEDCGQMSAWYVMSALGFYQIAPGIPVYTLGRPMIDKALIHVKGGIFEILVKNNSAANKYIKEVKLNGKILDTLFISHTDIIKGGKLEFIMTDQPVK